MALALDAMAADSANAITPDEGHTWRHNGPAGSSPVVFVFGSAGTFGTLQLVCSPDEVNWFVAAGGGAVITAAGYVIGPPGLDAVRWGITLDNSTTPSLTPVVI